MSLEYNKNLITYAKELRKNSTPQEKKLWYNFLSKYPVRFQRQKVIDNYIADFYCSKANIIIEIDGSRHFEKDSIEYDIYRTKILNSYKIKVIRFTNAEIDRNFNAICLFIDSEVQKNLPQSPSVTAPSKREP